MKAQIATYLRGIAVAVAAMLMFTVAIGMFLALALLVIAMETGGGNLSGSAIALARMITLLAQGTGFHTNSVVLTIMPLTLTMVMVALIRALAHRMKLNLRGYAAGLVTWVILDALVASGLPVTLTDSMALMLLKGAIVFSVGCLWAVLPDNAHTHNALRYIHEHVSQPVRHAVYSGIILGLLLLGIYAIIGIITVVTWICMNHDAMGTMFALLDMHTWSRVFMCIMALAWLPNIALWAMSWLFGAGFSVGSIATFSLWNGSATGLPSLPIFALFPTGVSNATLRMIFMAIPLVVSALVALIALTYKRGFPMGRAIHDGKDIPQRLLLSFAYPAGAFCITAVVVSLGSTLCFALSNGALGTQRLAHVGVNISQSTQAVAKSTAIGLFLVWLAALVIAAAVFAVRWSMRRNRTPQVSDSADSSVTQSADSTDHGESASATRKPRSAQSDGALHTGSESPNEHKNIEQSTRRVVHSTSNAKEHQGDNEPTVTTGIGIGLP